MARKPLVRLDAADLEWLGLLVEEFPGDALDQLVRSLVEKVPRQQQWKQATDAWKRNNPVAKKYSPSTAEAIAKLARKIARDLLAKQKRRFA
jgi:uncharacterized protein (DUF2384 family)